MIVGIAVLVMVISIAARTITIISAAVTQPRCKHGGPAVELSEFGSAPLADSSLAPVSSLAAGGANGEVSVLTAAWQQLAAKSASMPKFYDRKAGTGFGQGGKNPI